MKKLYLLVLSLSLMFNFFVISCGTSTGSRYAQETKDEKRASNEEPAKKKYPENFDISKYHAEIDTNLLEKSNGDKTANIWYGYSHKNSLQDTNQTVIRTETGYRVQVLSTDNLDDANQMRSDIYFKTDQKNVYIIFNPPFYKVEVGDFKNINDAKNLSFKLKQMGYQDARVINETINIYK